MGGLAQNEAMLLASRAFQGLGAALASPAALALITTTFPAGKERNRAFAVYAMMSGAGAAVGLILGGWLTGIHGFEPFGVHVDGWRLTFLIVVPIGLVAAAFAPRYFEESERHTGELDVPGAITGTLGLLGLVYGFSRAGEAAHGWGDSLTDRLARWRCGPAGRLRRDRVARGAPAAADPHLRQPDARRVVRGDDADAGRDVLDVLLPQPLHPEHHGLLPAQGGRRVPALQRRHHHLGHHRVQPGGPVRPPLHRRHRHR